MVSVSGEATANFVHDALDRLTSWTLNGSLQETYAYDPATGNLQTKGDLTLDYLDANHVHAVTSVGNQSSGNSYQYDQNGNQITRTIGNDTFNLLYDAENRLVEVKKNNATIAQFTYDGDGKRVKSVVDGETTLFVGSYYEQKGSQVTKYYFAGTTRIATPALAPGASVRKYVIPQNMTVEYLIGDHLGSTILTTDADGAKVSEVKYKPWGEVRYTWGSTPTDYTYTGQYSNVPEFGLMFYQARWYDPYITHFSQPDSIVPDPYNPQDLDRYSYGLNNPSRYTDPDGHRPCDDEKGCEGEWRYAKRTSLTSSSSTIQTTKKINKQDPVTIYVFAMQFQMFPSSMPYFYGEAGEEGYSGYEGGGDPIQPFGPIISRNSWTSVPSYVAGWFPIINDALLGLKPTVVNKLTPHSQTVYVGYTTSYQNIPSVNAATSTMVTDIIINNQLRMVVNYSVVLDSGSATGVANIYSLSAGTESVHVPLSSPVPVNGSINIWVQAITGCRGACYQSPVTQVFAGSGSFSFSP